MSDAGKTTLTDGADDGSTDNTYNVAKEITVLEGSGWKKTDCRRIF